MSRRGEEHTRKLSRRYPGFFIILLDQSGSMARPVEGMRYTKAQFTTSMLNTIIYEMIKESGQDENGRMPLYIYLSIFGYNDDVYPLLPSPLNISTNIIPLTYLADNPSRYKKLVRSDGQNKLPEEMRPIWIEESTQGRTEMKKAFEYAKEAIERWFRTPAEQGQADHQQCFPPVIINITDGDDNGDEGLLQVVKAIQKMETREGEPLIFNCHFTDKLTRPCVFPVNIEEIAYLNDELASKLFQISSPIPEALRNNAKAAMETDIRPNARCFIYNATPEILIKFLRWGTVDRSRPPSTQGQ